MLMKCRRGERVRPSGNIVTIFFISPLDKHYDYGKIVTILGGRYGTDREGSEAD